MVKTNATISIDSEIKKSSIEILKDRDIKFSNYVEECLKKLISDEKEVRK